MRSTWARTARYDSTRTAYTHSALDFITPTNLRVQSSAVDSMRSSRLDDRRERSLFDLTDVIVRLMIVALW